jgi:micrococcal nuclease
VRTDRRVQAVAVVLLTAACGAAEPPVAGQGLPVPAGAQEAVVVGITDGDTLRLRGRGTGPLDGDVTKVRVLLVDTPEVHGEQECLGPEASARAEQVVPVGSTVRVERDEDLLDRYDRVLLHVWNDQGVNLGERLLEEGLATVLQVEPNRRHLEHFEQVEQRARRAGRGLWSACP